LREVKLSKHNHSVRSSMRVLSVVEGTSVTGPIKPLLMFAGLARQGGDGLPAVDLSLVTTVRFRGTQIPTNLLLKAVAEAGIHVEVLHERRAWDPRVLAQLCRVIESHQPDVVETHQVKCHFMLAQALLWRRIRKNFAWIAYHHGYTKASLKLRFYESLDRWSLRKPDRIVTVCKPFAAELVRNGAPSDRLTVIPNAIESRPPPTAREIAALRRQWGLDVGDGVILSVGRLSPEKGHIDLITAFKRWLTLSPPQRQFTLLIVGDGPNRQKLERAAVDLGGRVRFLGHQADVWPLYFIADIFVLPSHSEGSPLVLLEAMAAQRPIVATAVGGTPETVEDELSAVLVPPHDTEQLAAALRRLSADSDRRARLGRSAVEALARFSPEAYRDRILTLYREVTSEP
jgi:glycosyltransferase involved in cell wall biosynthesis